MKCQRCSNEDMSYFYKGSKGYYCRKCIKFKRILIEETLYPKEISINELAYQYEMNYSLTDKQKKASQKVLEYIKDSDVLLYCVCGAGKTEIVLETISYYLRHQKKVCYAIARKEVVIELSERFKSLFKNNQVTTLCEGHNASKITDLVVCTTHQLYRFYKTFDLLILDEVDAFPFKGNEVLNNIAINSVKGHIIYSTATLDEATSILIKQRPYKEVSLYLRPHKHLLVVPEIRYGPKLYHYLYLYLFLVKKKTQVIIFVESKKLALLMYRLYKDLLKITYVTSDCENRDENIRAFKDKRYQFIIATTVLERGITIKGVDVVIINHLRGVFDKASLIQMAGRVGRSFDKPDGDVLILCNHIDQEVIKAKKEIEKANEMSIL